MSDELEAAYNRYIMKDEPDRDTIQRELTQDFIAWLLLRGDKTPDAIAEEFGTRYHGTLSWLGDDRQDEILKAAMQETGVDLTSWLRKN